MKMFEAKVDGVFCGREWDELQPKNAQAFGNAVRDFLSSKGLALIKIEFAIVLQIFSIFPAVIATEHIKSTTK